MKCPKCGADLDFKGELVAAEEKKPPRSRLRLALLALLALASAAGCAAWMLR